MIVLGCVRDEWTFPVPRDAATDSVATDSAAIDSAAIDAPAPDVGLADDATDSAATDSVATDSAATDSAATDSAATDSAATDSAATDATACGEGPVTLYRGEGTTLDSAGDQHATATGEVAYVEGRFGQGFSINGPRNYVTIPPTVGNFDGDFTIALWFKTRYWGVMLGRRAGCWNVPPYTGEDFDLTAEGYVAVEVFTSGPGYFSLHSPPGFNDGAWHHAAMVRRGDVFHLVVDGSTTATHAISGDFVDPSRSPSYLGVGRCTPGAPGSNGTQDGRAWYTGALDEVAFYDRALSPDELVAQARGLCAP